MDMRGAYSGHKKTSQGEAEKLLTMRVVGDAMTSFATWSVPHLGGRTFKRMRSNGHPLVKATNPKTNIGETDSLVT